MVRLPALAETRLGRGVYRSYRIRLLIQAYFAAVSILIGFQFARFLRAAEAGLEPLPVRPPGVEGYLPISGLLGLSLLLRRSFCAWICPAGLLSDFLARAGRCFFERIGTFGLGVILILAVASLFVHGAWCRYLCPYGALAGILSWISPTKVRREEGACIDCRRYDQVCPARLRVSQASAVTNPECTGCLDCLVTCPSPGALRVESLGRSLSPVFFAAALAALAVAGLLPSRRGDDG